MTTLATPRTGSRRPAGLLPAPAPALHVRAVTAAPGTGAGAGGAKP